MSGCVNCITSFENSTHARGTRAGTGAGESLADVWAVPACVPARGERGICKFHSRPRDAGGYESRVFAGGSLDRTRVRPRTRRRGIVKFHSRPRAGGTRAGTICEFMVKYGQMKHLASITALILPACAYAEHMVVPSLPDPLRPRAEAETNVTFSAGAAGDNLWRLSVDALELRIR